MVHWKCENQHCGCSYLAKTKTSLKQETYNLSDLKHDTHCGFVELSESVRPSKSVSVA
jgi:hypothetical protein